jgi:signal transduction histidine kinase
MHASGRRSPRRNVLSSAITLLVAGVGALASGRTWTRMDMRGRMGGGMGGMETVAANEPRVVAALVVIAALLAAGVWASRTRPRAAYVAVLALTAGYLVLNGPVPAALPAPAFALAALLRTRPQKEWAGWAALLLPTFIAPAVTSELGLADPALPGLVLLGVAWVILPSLAMQLSGTRRAAFAAHREEELRSVAYEERLRVARDIHDVVGHSLSMISLQSGVALHVLDSDPAQVRASLEAIREASRGSLAELRTTLGVFRQPDEGGPLVPTPSLGGVPGLVESVRAGGRTVGLVMAPGVAGGVPASVQAVAYRVVQEGLTNAVRHAPGATVAVSVERRAGALVVGVRDDGPATRAPEEGNGLRGMRERVEALGGRLSVGVRPGGGLAVEATLPSGDWS